MWKKHCYICESLANAAAADVVILRRGMTKKRIKEETFNSIGNYF
jgi:hypothetical protein